MLFQGVVFECVLHPHAYHSYSGGPDRNGPVGTSAEAPSISPRFHDRNGGSRLERDRVRFVPRDRDSHFSPFQMPHGRDRSVLGSRLFRGVLEGTAHDCRGRGEFVHPCLRRRHTCHVRVLAVQTQRQVERPQNGKPLRFLVLGVRAAVLVLGSGRDAEKDGSGGRPRDCRRRVIRASVDRRADFLVLPDRRGAVGTVRRRCRRPIADGTSLQILLNLQLGLVLKLDARGQKRLRFTGPWCHTRVDERRHHAPGRVFGLHGVSFVQPKRIAGRVESLQETLHGRASQGYRFGRTEEGASGASVEGPEGIR